MTKYQTNISVQNRQKQILRGVMKLLGYEDDPMGVTALFFF